MARFIDADLFIKYAEEPSIFDTTDLKAMIDEQPTAINTKELELRILSNFINCMPKVYRQRNCNWAVIRDILLNGTSTAGRTSCIDKCIELQINPYGNNFESEAN